MSNRNHLFTSESVSMGHPDKLADQISDAILDSMLAVDPNARVACETMVSTGLCVVAGEVTCNGYVEIRDVVRKTVLDVGYDDAAKGFDGNSCAVLVALDEQSPEISQGVTEGEGAHVEQGAGDQGLMFGYACRETDSLMPLAIDLSHKLVAKQAAVREADIIPHLRPDAKSQVTVEYDGHDPTRIDTVVISTQHGPEWTDNQGELKTQIIEHIITPVLGDLWHDEVVVHTNPTGSFERGGPHGDCGLTGRKIIVDTYGGVGVGGVALAAGPSGHRAAYMGRYIAKNLVAAGLCDRCEVQLSFAIGVAEPTSIAVETFGTEKVDPNIFEGLVREHFKLTPKGIIESLDLRNPIYLATAAHGHFGRVPGEGGEGTFSWEATDKAADLSNAASSTSSSSS